MSDKIKGETKFKGLEVREDKSMMLCGDGRYRKTPREISRLKSELQKLKDEKEELKEWLKSEVLEENNPDIFREESPTHFKALRVVLYKITKLENK